MPDRNGGPSPSVEPELSRDRCPSCDGPLRFADSRREGLCPACGIFVEILEPVVPDDIPANQSQEDVATRRELAAFDLRFEPASDDDVEAELEQVLEQVLDELDAPLRPVAEEWEPPPTSWGLPAREQAALVEGPILAGATDAAEAKLPELMATLPLEPEEEAAPGSAAATGQGAYRLWHRIVFHFGAVLAILGGAGLALGSLLHDVFHVPFVGTAYEAFGPVNASAALLGALAFASGALAMTVAARIGRSRRRPVAGG